MTIKGMLKEIATQEKIRIELRIMDLQDAMHEAELLTTFTPLEKKRFIRDCQKQITVLRKELR